MSGQKVRIPEGRDTGLPKDNEGRSAGHPPHFRSTRAGATFGAMTPLPAIVISDVHLGGIPADREIRFRRWFAQVGDRTRHLVINGDLFDFWFEYGSVIPRGYTRTLSILASLVDAGVRIDMFGGNHDWWGGAYLEQEIGVHFHREPARIELAGRPALIAHGDGLGNGDLGYRLLKLLLRGRFTRWGFRWIHPDLGAWAARRVSRTEMRGDLEHAPSPERVLALERWARDRLLDDETLDMVLLGHTHQPERKEVAPGRWYLNSGDWIHHCTWVEIPPNGEPRLQRLDGPNTG